MKIGHIVFIVIGLVLVCFFWIFLISKNSIDMTKKVRSNETVTQQTQRTRQRTPLKRGSHLNNFYKSKQKYTH